MALQNDIVLSKSSSLFALLACWYWTNIYVIFKIKIDLLMNAMAQLYQKY